MTGRRARRWRRAKLAFAGIAALVAAAAWGMWSVMTPVGRGGPQLVVVSRGQSVWTVASGLRRQGLVRSATALTAAAYVTGRWRRIQAGRYDLDPGMTGLEMLDALGRGTHRAWRWLTIPEGFTVWQVAQAVESHHLGSARDFLAEAARPGRFSAPFPLPQGDLEGYLFPDTYRVDVGEGVRDIIAQMLGRFDQVVWRGLFEGKAIYRGRTMHDILILASMVEAEAKRDDERPIIAAVLLNRLKRGQRLECDATVQYALGQNRRPRLTYRDLEVDSDYNTYLHAGLPPGPICSPGEASIRAAMDPADVPYLYYVARPDGSHVFSKTFAEHQAAIAKVRRERD